MGSDSLHLVLIKMYNIVQVYHGVSFFQILFQIYRQIDELENNITVCTGMYSSWLKHHDASIVVAKAFASTKLNTHTRIT